MEMGLQAPIVVPHSLWRYIYIYIYITLCGIDNAARNVCSYWAMWRQIGMDLDFEK